MKKESIIYGTAILICTNFIVKLLSLVYKAILIRVVGIETIGLSELLSPAFSFLLVLASLGIPLAISNISSNKLATGNHNKVISIVKTGALILLINSVIVIAITIAVFPFVKDIIFSDSRIYLGFIALLPSVLIISLTSAIRGYFQGIHQTSNLGKSQVVEQFARVIIGLTIITSLVNRNYSIEILLFGLAITTLLAELSGGTYLFYKFQKNIKGVNKKNKLAIGEIKNMYKIGTPVTISRLITSIAITLQALITAHALINAGYSPKESAILYGYFSGVALTILHLPAIITSALSIPLLPALAEAKSKNQLLLQRSRINDSLLFTILTGFPILALLFYYAKPICDILFASPNASDLLRLLCIGGVFVYLQQPLNSIMQGLGYYKTILVNLIISNGIYIASLIYVTSLDGFTIEKAVILFMVNSTILCVLTLIELKIRVGISLSPIKLIISPLLSVLGGLFSLKIISQYLPQITGNSIGCIILGSIIFICCYLIILYIFGGIDKNTIDRLISPLSRMKNRAKS